MTRDDILQLLNGNRDLLNELKVKRLALFGSVERGDETSESDLDVLVEFTQPISLSLYMNLKFFLEELVGREVDLVTPDAIRPRLRPHIEKDTIYVGLQTIQQYNNSTMKQ